VKTLQDIQYQLAKHKERLFEKYPIHTLAIFGSYARKTQNESSDVDLLVDFNNKIGIRFIDLADDIEEILNTKVDLVSRGGIKKQYFEAIKSDLIYV